MEKLTILNKNGFIQFLKPKSNNEFVEDSILYGILCINKNVSEYSKRGERFILLSKINPRFWESCFSIEVRFKLGIIYLRTFFKILKDLNVRVDSFSILEKGNRYMRVKVFVHSVELIGIISVYKSSIPFDLKSLASKLHQRLMAEIKSDLFFGANEDPILIAFDPYLIYLYNKYLKYNFQYIHSGNILSDILFKARHRSGFIQILDNEIVLRLFRASAIEVQGNEYVFLRDLNHANYLKLDVVENKLLNDRLNLYVDYKTNNIDFDLNTLVIDLIDKLSRFLELDDYVNDKKAMFREINSGKMRFSFNRNELTQKILKEKIENVFVRIKNEFKDIDLIFKIVPLSVVMINEINKKMNANREWGKSIFIAHAKEDKDSAMVIYNDILSVGLEPWLDIESLNPGDIWDDEIQKAIKRSRIFIACLSNESVDKDGYIQKELRLALNTALEKPPGKQYIIPLMINEVAIPEIVMNSLKLSDFQAIKFYDEKEYRQLLDFLCQELIGKDNNS